MAARSTRSRSCSGSKVALEGKYFVLPGTKQVPLLPDAVAEYAVPDPKIYGVDKPYPASRRSEVNVQSRRGVTFILVNLNPVEYRPRSGELWYYDRVSLKITTRPVRAGKPVLRYRPDPVHPITDGVENPGTIDTYAAPRSEGGASASDLCDPAQTFQYVIITNEALKAAPSNPGVGTYNFQDLLAFKAAAGLSGTIVTVEQIYARYPGTDEPDQIRNFIIDAYNNWKTEFVLLGGDGDGDGTPGGEAEPAVVPARKLDCADDVEPKYSKDAEIPSDMYYQCLDGTWDFNNDKIYGRPGDGPNGGEVDTFAEVYVGRAMVSTPAHVSAFVEKTIRYTKAANASYVTSVLMVGEHLGFGGVSEYATNSMEEIRTGGTFNGVTCAGIPGNFTVDTLYDSPTFIWPKTEIINKSNSNKYHIIHHLGHCANHHLMKMNATVGPGDLVSILNRNLVFIYSQGCFPGAFDNYFFGTGGYINYDAIGEKLLRNNQYGMAAGVLNARYGWGALDSTDGASQWYHREFVNACFGKHIRNLGAINAESHEANTWRLASSNTDGGVARWCMYQTNLFGDPHLVLNGVSPTRAAADSGTR